MSMEVGMESVSMWRRPMEALSSDGVKELHRLQAENAKLRELVKEAHLCMVNEGCYEDCYATYGECPIEMGMRKLGIEADE